MNLRPFDPIQSRGLTLKQVTPTVSPITVNQFAQYARIDTPDQAERDLIGDILLACTEWAETYTTQPATELEFIAEWDVAGGELTMPRNPVVSVESLTINGEAVGTFDLYGANNEILSIPEAGYRTRVEFTAGYATLPASYRIALLKMALTAYENREDLMESGTLVPVNAKTFFSTQRRIVI
jgi:hypothetical protein